VKNTEVYFFQNLNSTVISIYKPPNTNLAFEKLTNFDNSLVKIAIWDFNSYSCTWGYLEIDLNGEKVEEWTEAFVISSLS